MYITCVICDCSWTCGCRPVGRSVVHPIIINPPLVPRWAMIQRQSPVCGLVTLNSPTIYFSLNHTPPTNTTRDSAWEDDCGFDPPSSMILIITIIKSIFSVLMHLCGCAPFLLINISSDEEILKRQRSNINTLRFRTGFSMPVQHHPCKSHLH